MSKKKCSYKGCMYETQSPLDNQFCLFHSERKFGSNQDFVESLFEHLRSSFDMSGFRFKHAVVINFQSAQLEGQLKFHDCHFQDQVLFKNFNLKGELDFNNCEFEKRAMLQHCNIDQLIHKPKSPPLRGAIRITKCRFKDDFYLHGIGLKNASIYAFESEYTKEFVYQASQMDGLSILVFRENIYKKIRFHNSKIRNVNFDSCQINGDADFQGLEYIDSGISFKRINFGDSSSFQFKGGRFIGENTPKSSLVGFSETIFPPYRSQFLDFGSDGSNRPKLVLDFKRCVLTGVYFVGCDLGVISLNSSRFDQAIFLNCTWFNLKQKFPLNLVKHSRRGIIYEERLLRNETNQNSSEVSIEEVINVYSILKTSFDSQKRYFDAGEFYLNENELRRKLFLKEKRLSNYIIVSLISFLTGYSQRPFRALLFWFLSLIMFSLYNLYLGITVSSEGQIILAVEPHTNFGLRYLLDSSFWENFESSSVYSLSKIIPFNLLRSYEYSIVPNGNSNWILIRSILFSFFSILMLGSFTIGIRRLLRRF